MYCLQEIYIKYEHIMVHSKMWEGDNDIMQIPKQSWTSYTDTRKCALQPWVVWLSGLSASLQIKASLVRFPVRAHAWVVDQVPSRGRVRGSHTLFLSLSFYLPLSLKINK